ncbi:MAG: M1 family aminopeptidase [candidate division WOR-3 bacterium]
MNFLLFFLISWHTGKFSPNQLLAESTHTYDVRFYHLEINLPMSERSYTAKEIVTIKSLVPILDTFSLHFSDLVCDSVKREGINLLWSTGNGYLSITLDEGLPFGESTDITIFFHRDASIPNNGFLFYPKSGNTLHNIAYTCTEPSDSRTWFACWDEPWDKAERGVELFLTVPDSFSVCANGLLDSVSHNPENRTKTYFWRHSYPIATYLICFASSIYATFSHWHHISPTESLEIKYYIWPEDSTAATNSFRNTPLMMTFFSDTNLYGPYPFEKYGMVSLYPFAWGGMEHQTMTGVHRQWVTQGSEGGIAHELSHQWWGDMVTCFNWANIWLNEGFATYSDALYLGYRNGRAYFLNLMNSRKNIYFQEDASMRFPLYDPPPNQLFAYGHIYCKGSWLQHMLRYIIGDTTAHPGIFFRALRVYGDSFKYKSANTEDYKRILERITGLNLENFFREWVYLAGYPNYNVLWSKTQEGDSFRVEINITQNNGNLAPTVFHIPVQVLLKGTTDTVLITIPIDTSPQINTYYLSFEPNQLTFDPGNWLLHKATVRLGVTELSQKIPPLLEIYPNPFSHYLKINLSLSSPIKGELALFEPTGRKVLILDRGEIPIGIKNYTLNLRKLKSGVYLLMWNGKSLKKLIKI